MTNEKAIDVLVYFLKRITGIPYIEDGIIKPTYKTEAFGKAMVALAKEDKYRWHSLKKNPEDLPPDDEDVYVKAKMYCKWDNQYRIFVIQMSYNRKIMYGKPIGWSHSYPYMFEFETDEVIAWRYIDLFEEDKDD